MANTAINRPVPSNNRVPGSGTGAGDGDGVIGGGVGDGVGGGGVGEGDGVGVPMAQSITSISPEAMICALLKTSQ